MYPAERFRLKSAKPKPLGANVAAVPGVLPMNGVIVAPVEEPPLYVSVTVTPGPTSCDAERCVTPLASLLVSVTGVE